LQIDIVFDKQNAHRRSTASTPAMPTAITPAAIAVAIIATAIITMPHRMVEWARRISIVAKSLARIAILFLIVAAVISAADESQHASAMGIGIEPDDPPIRCHPFDAIARLTVGTWERSLRIVKRSRRVAADFRQNAVERRRAGARSHNSRDESQHHKQSEKNARAHEVS
jgi:hypothetical protein